MWGNSVEVISRPVRRCRGGMLQKEVRKMDYLTYDGWKITFQGGKEEREKSVPTLLCIGNGSLGIRGTVPETEQWAGKGTFAAGFFDKLPRPEVDFDSFTPFLKAWSYEEETKKYHLEEALVNCPDVLCGYFESEGERFLAEEEKKEDIVRTLDMRSGEVFFSVPVRTASGRRGVVTRRRFVSMERQEAIFEECSFESLNFEGAVTYHAWVDTDTKNFNISGIYQDAAPPESHAYYRLYDVLEQEEKDLYTVVRGRCNGYKLYIAGAVQGTGRQQAAGREEPEKAQERAEKLPIGGKMSIVRKCVVLCDRIQPADKNRVLGCLREIEGLSYEEALAENSKSRREIWEVCDIGIEGDLRMQTGIRHNLYLLNLSFCDRSDQVSVAAKGLTGEGYRGMVFWDTDIHMLPFFLYTRPDKARNLVSFRYQTLAGARAKAAKYGGKGASFPWETGISGYEECEGFLKLITHQLHITADVAYAVGKYVEATGDEAFYVEEAAELFLETARFWIGRGHMENGKFCISQASGPDELHLESDNNAYLLNMVGHNLELADRAAEKLESCCPERWETLREKIKLTEEERAKIREYKDCINTMKGERGLYEQCEGFFTLEDRIVYENDPEIVPADTQTVKQADTLMCLYLLPHLANQAELLENWNYYEPRTTHTSSLSYGVHGILASKLGLAEKARYYLDRSMGLDLFEESSHCEDGAHLAAAGMSWSAVICGIAGVAFEEEGISLSPSLPENWEALTFSLAYQGSRMAFEITREKVRIYNRGDAEKEAVIRYQGRAYRIGEGETVYL